MPSCDTYCLTWVSLTLDEGYLLTAAPPDLEGGVAPLGPPVPAQPLLLGHVVAPLGCCPWPLTWGSSSSLCFCVVHRSWHASTFLRSIYAWQLTIRKGSFSTRMSRGALICWAVRSGQGRGGVCGANHLPPALGRLRLSPQVHVWAALIKGARVIFHQTLGILLPR